MMFDGFEIGDRVRLSDVGRRWYEGCDGLAWFVEQEYIVTGVSRGVGVEIEYVGRAGSKLRHIFPADYFERVYNYTTFCSDEFDAMLEGCS